MRSAKSCNVAYGEKVNRYGFRANSDDAIRQTVMSNPPATTAELPYQMTWSTTLLLDYCSKPEEVLTYSALISDSMRSTLDVAWRNTTALLL